MNGALRLAALAAAFAMAVTAAEKWRIQFFYDQDESSLTINDLKFASARVGVAVGFVTERNRVRPSMLLTLDGGEHWNLEPTKEPGHSLFFLNDSLGWMVTPNGIWRTEEAGRSWLKVSGLKNILRVFFLTPDRGFAVGGKKAIYETADGGKEWSKVAAATLPKTSPEYTTYGSISFANPEVGIITGWHRPPRRADEGLPDWVDTDQAHLRREWPGTALFLETRDAGKTWKLDTGSMFGRVSKAKLFPSGFGIGLVELTASLEEWPSEIYLINWKSGKSERAFRDRYPITDFETSASLEAVYLAEIEARGQLRRSPVPGKLRILKSKNIKDWTPMDVDYRASARRAVLAAAGHDGMWAATDTGMILKLVPQP